MTTPNPTSRTHPTDPSDSTNPSWTGMVPVDDTALAVTDTGGPGCPVVYLNGAYASQRHWRHVIGELGAGLRHITFDERARGRSRRSADYSFEACVRDVDAVLEARGVDRAIVVGWSYGAATAVHWAERNPDRAMGVVCADGGLPYGLTGEEGQERIRTLFRKMRFLLPLVRPFGLAARMSADQHAEVNIEANQVHADLAPVLDRVTVPVRYVLATDGNLGGGDEEMEEARASLDPVIARNPNIRVSSKVPSNHSHILRKDFRAVAAVVRELATASDRKAG
ncbi:alpha/beta fold hydrolase [Nocardiopsis aegyptia]|uniref:alpha/beta fold hydrolase n=1 Tax=Nocardiopsis aegyptia TaxID=220378 RepID=UPI003672DFFB